VDAPPIEPPLTDADMCDVVAVLERLHASRSIAKLGREDFTLSFEDDIDASLDRAATGAHDAGPYGARIRALVRAHRDNLAELRTELKDLATACASVDEPPVLTHGEPHPGNILRHGDRLLLADWTELQWGPPERDWYHVISTIGAGPRCRPEFFRFYEIKWWLSELAEYAARFLGPHRGDHEDAAMWSRLVEYFPTEI
jgi:spectinomycin phosphotransferase